MYTYVYTYHNVLLLYQPTSTTNINDFKSNIINVLSLPHIANAMLMVNIILK